MQSILKELFYGNIAPNAKQFVRNSEYGKGLKTVSDCEEKLNTLLSGKELGLFEKLMKAQSDSSYINGQEFFIEGFRLGARIALEIMDQNDGCIIDVIGWVAVIFYASSEADIAAHTHTDTAVSPRVPKGQALTPSSEPVVGLHQDQLKLLQTEVMTELIRSKRNVDRLMLRQQQGFQCVMPSGWNVFREQFERVLPASSVANLYPFNYSGKTDANGFYVGRDKFGSNVLLDFNKRADDKTNANILILGNSGQGKSYLLKLILTNLRESGMNVCALDPEMEYEDLTNNRGGCFIDHMSGEFLINVLEPKTWDEHGSPNDADAPQTFRISSKLSQHISFLKDFFKLTAVEYVHNFSKRVRKKDSAVIIASQNLEDFNIEGIREYTKPLFSTPTHQFLFNAGNIDAKFYIDTLQLEQSEYNLIRYPQRGVCLYKCGNERYNLMVSAPEHEARLFGKAGGR